MSSSYKSLVHPTIAVGIWLEGRVNRRRGRVAVCGEGDLVELVEVVEEEVEVEEREMRF